MSGQNKRFLVTCTELMMLQFLIPHVNHLLESGNDVDIACSEVGGRFNQLSGKFIKQINMYKIAATRSPWKTQNLTGYRQLKQVIDQGNYDVIWTNEPVMGVITRLAALNSRKRATKVMYMAHGFHFYKGAPLQNWLVYYPIEKFLSRYTDVLITINKEDYARASKHFYAKSIYYIHGIGVDIKRFSECPVTKEEKRAELGLPQDAFVLLSVGELASRKNQQVVLNALGQLQNPSIYYVMAGRGPLAERYKESARNMGIENNVLLLGPRTDVDELCRAADVFVHPSVREGLGIAPLEAMASGLPLITSYVNGIKDYTQDGVTGCCISNPSSVTEMCAAIMKMINEPLFRMRCGENNKEIVRSFDIEKSIKEMNIIYGQL